MKIEDTKKGMTVRVVSLDATEAAFNLDFGGEMQATIGETHTVDDVSEFCGSVQLTHPNFKGGTWNYNAADLELVTGDEEPINVEEEPAMFGGFQKGDTILVVAATRKVGCGSTPVEEYVGVRGVVQNADLSDNSVYVIFGDDDDSMWIAMEDAKVIDRSDDVLKEEGALLYGTKVRIKSGTRFASQSEAVGTVVGDGLSPGWYGVKFDDGYSNDYEPDDLEVVEEGEEVTA